MSTKLRNGRFPSILTKPFLLAFLLAGAIFQAMGQDEQHTISGQVIDRDGRPLAGVTINACDLSKQPVLLIPGGDGSSSLSEDSDGLAHIYRWMRADGYLEGCNLFFADNVTGFQSREANQQAIQEHIRRAYQQVLANNPRWPGHFDLIGHSYGGLLARFYLESSYYAADQTIGIQVDNLVTLGTPHGGFMIPTEIYPAALAIISDHLLDPADRHEFLGALQLHSVLMDLYNMLHHQPDGVRYHLFGGDFLQQAAVPLAIRLLYAPYNDYPGDIVVSLRSVGSLAFSPLLQNLYPRTCLYFNDDFHGYKDSLGLGNLKSYVYPQTTYREQIRDIIGIREESCPEWATQPTEQFLAPRQTEFNPPLLAAEGVLDGGEEAVGSFTIDWSGTTVFSLVSQGGEPVFSLSSPGGQVLDAQMLRQNPQIMQDTLRGPSSTLTTFVIEAEPGQWDYILSLPEGSNPASYRMTAYHASDLTPESLLPPPKGGGAFEDNQDLVSQPPADSSGAFQVGTGDDGRFKFPDLPPGTYLLQPQQNGLIFDPPSQIITLSDSHFN